MTDLKAINIDTIATCGDDSRGVVCGSDPEISHQVQTLATESSERLIPKTSAYSEIWYQRPAGRQDNEEPFYGQLYLPRKLKVGYVLSPVNDIDVFAQDVGFIAIIENHSLKGFNVCRRRHGDEQNLRRLVKKPSSVLSGPGKTCSQGGDGLGRRKSGHYFQAGKLVRQIHRDAVRHLR